jgi:cytochrome P450
MTQAPLRALPSRFSLPLLGDTLHFLKDPAGLLEERAKELGPVFEINVLGSKTACFVGPAAFSLVLDDKNVQRQGANPPHVEQLFNPEAVPFLDGEKQRKRKRALMQAFTPDALDEYLPIIEQVVDRYADKWAARRSFQWVPELTSMGMSIASSLFIGADPAKDDPAIERAFDKFAAGILALPINLPGTTYAKALAARTWLLRRIEEAIAKPQKGNALARLLATDLTKDEVRIETFHFFGAFVPVIGGLSMLLQRLGTSPQVRARLRQEVKSIERINIDALKTQKYLDNVVKEARRVSPVLAITFFGKVVRELSFDGVRIPQGHKAVGCIGPTLLDPKLYPNPETFDPDRWNDATPEQQRGWIPHGGGVHTEGHRCAGEQLATLMLKVVAIKMLKRFEWSIENQDLRPTKGKLFATPASGLPVQLKDSPAS